MRINQFIEIGLSSLLGGIYLHEVLKHGFHLNIIMCMLMFLLFIALLFLIIDTFVLQKKGQRIQKRKNKVIMNE